MQYPQISLCSTSLALVVSILEMKATYRDCNVSAEYHDVGLLRAQAQIKDKHKKGNENHNNSKTLSTKEK